MFGGSGLRPRSPRVLPEKIAAEAAPTMALLGRVDLGALLTELAGGAERYLEAPEAEALEALYSRLAPVIPCPGGRHDWGADWP